MSYNIKSEFELKKPGTARYSFGMGRSHFKKVYVPGAKLNDDPLNPGPGKYTVKYFDIGKNG